MWIVCGKLAHRGWKREREERPARFKELLIVAFTVGEDEGAINIL